MRFGDNFFPRYLKQAPIPLALERSLECEILSKQEFRPPVLDIGCGDGLFASILFAEEIDLGVDRNKRELDRAQEHDIYKELIQCSGNNVPKDDRSFNTIFANSTLEHILDLAAVLKEVHRLLSDDGDFYLTVPSHLFDQYTIINVVLTKLGLESLSRKWRALFNWFWAHYQHYPVHEWVGLFEQNGFTVEEIVEYGSKKTCLLDDFLVPFSIHSWFMKRMFNRWALCPSARALITYPVRLLVTRGNIEQAIGVSNGGLIFFRLRKK